MNGLTVRTFLSANTSEGFFSFFNEFLKGKTSYVIKGGPGTGKSSFMKKMAAKAVSQNYFTEYVYCSSDPDSLDGIYIHGAETVFTDGTSPHIMEPEYTGVKGGIVDVGQFLDKSKLSTFENDIETLSSAISAQYSRAYKFLKATKCICEDIEERASHYFDKEAFISVLKKAYEKNVGDKRGCGGVCYHRFLSGITPKGFITLKDTVYTLCSRVCVVRDKYGLSHVGLAILRDMALSSGFDVYDFRSPLEPQKTVHVAIPEADVAFVTSDYLVHFVPQNAGSVNVSRFISEDISMDLSSFTASSKIEKLCFNTVFDSLSLAKAFHDDLEDIYASAMDFPAVDELTQKYSKMVF